MKEIGIAKFVVPQMALQVVDRAIQSYGAEGLSQDTPLANIAAGLRTLRFADVCTSLSGRKAIFLTSCQGPDEVHIQQIGKTELKRSPLLKKKTEDVKRKEQALYKKSGIKAHL